MKIAAIKRMCLGERMCRILTGQQGQQWIGTSRAIFRVDDGLRITQESIKGLFDLDQAQMDKLAISEQELELAPIWPMMRRDQNKMSECPLRINNYGGVELLAHDGRMYMCSIDAIKAAVDRGDYREYWLGYDRFNAPLIIVRDGLIFAGVIRPEPKAECEFILRAMEDWAQMIAAGMGVDEEPRQEEAPEGEQVAMVRNADVAN